MSIAVINPAMRVSSIFDQVFSDEQLIVPGQFLAANAVGGVVLTLFALALGIDPAQSDPNSLALLVAGLALLALVLVAKLRARLLTRALIAQGVVVCTLGVWLTLDTIQWALTTPSPPSFHYAPGAITMAFTYGTLQIGSFVRLRVAGLIAGVALELVAAGFVLVRMLG